MLSPDEFFKRYHSDFPPQTRPNARKLFRRAIRDYYVMQRKYVIEPESGERVHALLVGEFVQHQKTQRRKVSRLFKGRLSAGRPPKPEIKLLVSRLFILWGRYAKQPATFSWKKKSSIKTEFEIFLQDLLPRLGAPDVRRYVETHWRERK